MASRSSQRNRVVVGSSHPRLVRTRSLRAPNRHNTGSTIARSVDEVALIRDTISHYAPVLFAPLSNPSRQRVGNFFWGLEMFRSLNGAINRMRHEYSPDAVALSSERREVSVPGRAHHRGPALDRTLSVGFVKLGSTPVVSSRARSLRICRSCSRASSSSSSTPRPPGCSASLCRTSCWLPPTRWSNKGLPCCDCSQPVVARSDRSMRADFALLLL
jgi:hypothetical protein